MTGREWQPIPADWSTFYANAAQQDIARGNSRAVRVLLRDARRAALSEMGFGPACVRNSRARRQLAGGAEHAPGLFPNPVSTSTHNGAINP